MMDSKLPSTTKSNKLYHGYGLKSIQAAAQKYGGTMTVSSSDHWFILKVLIPVSEKEPS
jgi:sensor histidine kinase regulating citrate/malate metabolism